MQVLQLGRAPRTKETLPDFLKWRRVTRHPLVFRGLTGSQPTPGFWGVTKPVLQYPTLGASKNMKFRLSRNSTKFDVIARFRETIPTVKSVSSFEI